MFFLLSAQVGPTSAFLSWLIFSKPPSKRSCLKVGVFFPSPSPCTHMLCPFERRTWLALASGVVSPKGLTPLTSAFMPFSLEEDEFDAGCLAPACRI